MHPRCKKCGEYHTDSWCQLTARPVIPSSYASPIETAPLQRTENYAPGWSPSHHCRKEAA